MKLLRITTVPISLKLLITGQMRYMSENGFEVLMVSADGKERQSVMETEGCPHFIVPFTRTISPFADLKCLWQLVRLLKREKPDIVHTHTPKAGLLGMWAARLCGVKAKLHTVAGLPLMTATGWKRKLLVAIEKLTYQASDYVLPNSNSLRDYLTQHHFLPQHKIHFIGKGSSNGIDLKRFSKEKLEDELLEKTKNTFGYQSGLTYLLCIGRVVRDKGIIELVDAFLALKNDFPKIRLLLVGPIEKERAEEILPTHTIEAIENDLTITHIPWSDQVEYLMASAHLLIHASHREGFPNVPLQAGAIECPIICSAIPGNIDIVQDGNTGLLFEAGNGNDLEQKIRYALVHQHIMDSYAKSLRQEVVEKFSRSYLQGELLAFYKKVLKEKQ